MNLSKQYPEKKHYDVAVLSVWFGSNYGSLLNGFAVYKMLKSMNKSVLMINKIGAKPNDGEINGTLSARFIDEFYPEEEISPLYSYDRLKELNDYIDTFLVGSDQIFDYYICSYFHNAFMLGFANDDKRKISYATSFGHMPEKTPPDKIEERRLLFKRFDAISVREQSGVDIFRENYGINATHTLEPVFCIDRSEFDAIATKSSMDTNTPYILTYILDPTPEKRELIQFYEKYSGKNAINILDGQPHTFKENTEKLGLPNCLTGIDAKDFLKLYKDAAFVITDSFHGTAFSIIYNKPFLSIANARRGYTRFEDLLGRFDLMDRLVYDRDLNSFANKSPRFLREIDYTDVNRKIEIAKKDSLQWLKDALSKKHNKSIVNVNDALGMLQCSGCGACAAICPADAISMKPDAWGYYRSSVDVSKCIQCKKCLRVCPALELPKNENSPVPHCFAFVSADENNLTSSSSGGVFAHLANQTFQNHGAVVGAAWKDDFSVEHIIIYNRKELHRLQKSKYLQSSTENTYRETKQILDKGKNVLYTGTPCQIYGLRAYLGREYDNLICIDLLCSNAPSSMFFRKYLDETFGNNIKSYEFRYKPVNNPVWDCSHIIAELNDDKTIVRNGPTEDAFQRVFHNHTMCSQHCQNCQYQRFPRPGDLSIGDFWGIGKYDPGIDTKKGVSIVLCNNRKGLDFFNAIPEKNVRLKKEVSLDWMGGNGLSRIDGRNFISPYRDKFYKAILTMPFSKAVDYALAPSSDPLTREFYKDTNSPLRYDCTLLHFRFEKDIWEEHCINGYTTLIVKKDKWKELGHYARLKMATNLKHGQKYIFTAKFKIKTASDILNLHIIESKGKRMQIIQTVSVKEKNDGQHWIEVRFIFKPNEAFYDEFMVGAGHLKGENNFIMIDYILINEQPS